MNLREILGRMSAWRRREELDRGLADELQEHLDRLARDFEHHGMSATDARAAAHRQLGNLTSLREQSRDAWGFPHFEQLMQDLRYALRGLRRSPGFTATVVITLGLGIGANAAMFGVIDRLMFRPYPLLREPDQVHRVYLETTFEGRTNANMVFPYTRYLDLVRGTPRMAAHAAMSEWRLGVGSSGDTQVRKVAGVSASFFTLFDAPPALGRYFTASEDSLPMGSLVAVLSYGLWKGEFASANVVGKPLKVGKLVYTIIGVATEGFVGTVSGRVPEVFVPITTIPANLDPSNQSNYYTKYNWDWTEVLVRRAPGMSVETASEELSRAYIASRAAARAINPRVLPDSVARPKAIAGPVKGAAGPGKGPESKVLLWVSGVALVVLLIACASVANLMIARVIRRRREITLRLALGVSRARLVMQFLTESLLMALLGGVAGLLIAQWSGVAIRGLLLPQGSTFNLADDWRTIGMAFACALVATVVTAVGPALVATRTDMASMLKSGSREGTQHKSRLRTVLLMLQVSLSVLLLIGAALFVRSFDNARALPLGYDATPVLEVVSDFRGQDLVDSAAGPVRFRLLRAAQELPGVAYAANVNSGLFATNTAELRVTGIDSVAALGRFNFQMATPDYFKVMQTRILRGRALEESDRGGAALVAVVSEAMGKALWPDRDPIGQCLFIGMGERPNTADAPCTTVVGIAENTFQQNLTDDKRFMYYLPMAQRAPNGTSMMRLRMTNPDAISQLERVRRELTRAMPGDGFVFVRPLQEVVDDKSRSWKLGATLFVAFGGLAFVVAVVGIYGLISYNVAGRTHELGVRLALGARPSALVRMVVGQGVRSTAIGVTIGLILAWVASRWIEPLLFRQSATDVLTYAIVASTMILVAVAACVIPARRASRVNPTEALRAD